jgi:hypothetical protein
MTFAKIQETQFSRKIIGMIMDIFIPGFGRMEMESR